MPLVSVVTPAFEAEKLLGEAAQSLLDQSFPDWEMIVVSDDGNDYLEILPRDDRIRHCHSGGYASGPGAARNVGLSHCRGALVTHLDSDDRFLPDRLEKLVPLAMEHGGAIDNMLIVDHEFGEKIANLFEFPEDFLDFCGALDLDCPIFPVYRKELAGRWDEEFSFAEDVLFNLRAISRIGRIAVSPEPMMEYRVRSGSVSCSEEGCLKAERAYVEIIARIAESGLGFSPECFEPLCRMFLRKAALNRDFLNSKGCMQVKSFAEYAYRLDTMREVQQNSGWTDTRCYNENL